MSYFQTDNLILTNPTAEDVNEAYNKGFVLTRKGKWEFIQTRSLRVNLEKFELNSENRRILNKNSNLQIKFQNLPLEDYIWEIHAMGKTFYTERFGDGTMSASKIKELFTDTTKSNMNCVFVYKYTPSITGKAIADGYSLSYSNEDIIHYAYPFYDMGIPKENNLGMAMMIKAITFGKDNVKKYVYLGSVTDKKSLYKLQFSGLEWFDTDSKSWTENILELKNLITQIDTE